MQLLSGNTKYTKKSQALEIWRYIYSQTTLSSFQQAVLRNLNDKNSQLQKQLDNVVREGKANIQIDICRVILVDSKRRDHSVE